MKPKSGRLPALVYVLDTRGHEGSTIQDGEGRDIFGLITIEPGDVILFSDPTPDDAWPHLCGHVLISYKTVMAMSYDTPPNEKYERRTLHDRFEMIRASGDCLCKHCGGSYRDHAMDTSNINLAEESPFLHVLCDGTRVKL